MIRLVIVGFITLSPLAHAAFSKAEAQQLVDNLLQTQNRARLCQKGSFSTESIRAGAGKYCVSDPGATLAFYMCKDFTDTEDGKKFLTTDCGKKLKPTSYTGSMLDRIAMLDGNSVCDLISKFDIKADACKTIVCPKELNRAQLKLLEPRKTALIGKYNFQLVSGTQVPEEANLAKLVTSQSGECYYLPHLNQQQITGHRAFQIKLVR